MVSGAVSLGEGCCVCRSRRGFSLSVGSSSPLASSAMTMIAATTATASRIQAQGMFRRFRSGAVGGGTGAVPVMTCVAGAATAAAGGSTAVPGSRRAAANAAASGNRSAGSLDIARRTTAARSRGTSPGRSGTGSRRWASAVATGVSPTNGRRPARHSKATTPRE